MKTKNLNVLADLALNAIELKMKFDRLDWILLDAQNYVSQSEIDNLELELDDLWTSFNEALEKFVVFAVKHCVSRKQAMQLFDDACLDSYQHANGGELPPPPPYDGMSYYPIIVDDDRFRTFIMKNAPSPSSEFVQFSLFLSTIGVKRQPVKRSKTASDASDQDDASAAFHL